MEKKFSLKSVVITCAFTFLISGVGGALFTRFLARPKPSVVITSVGFAGGRDFIPLDDGLMRKSEEDSWGDSFSRFEPFNTLLEREQKCRRLYELLDLVAKESASWLKRHSTDDEASTPLIPKAALEVHPVTLREAYMGLVAGAVLREELTELPERLERSPDARMFRLSGKLGEGEQYVVQLNLPDRVVPIVCRDPQSEAQLELTWQIAESFAQGNRTNVVFLTEYFVNQAGTDCRALEDLRKRLTPILLKNARLRLTATLMNTGGRSVVFRPYFIASLIHEEFEHTTFILKAQNPLQGTTETSRSALLSALGVCRTFLACLFRADRLPCRHVHTICECRSEHAHVASAGSSRLDSGG